MAASGDLFAVDRSRPRADLIARIALAGADAAAEHARVLARHDPSWGTDELSLAGGRVVLCGKGLYVNRALALGVTAPVTDADLDVLERRSAAVGVDASVEVVPTADESLLRLTARRGYVLERFLTTHALALPAAAAADSDVSISIERGDGALLAQWLDVAARGFGVDDGALGRRASDAFARAAAEVDGAGFLIARSADDLRPLGVASVTILHGIATLGAMTTVPDERRRGVQRALIAHRLRLAADAGCDLAVSSTVPGNASERNLARAGFRPLFESATVTQRRGAPRTQGEDVSSEATSTP